MFGDALAGHAKMPAELVQSLAILEMQLIEEGAPAWVGQSFKDSVHVVTNMQLKGCIFVRPSQPREWEWQLSNRSALYLIECFVAISSSGKASGSRYRSYRYGCAGSPPQSTLRPLESPTAVGS